MAETRVLPLQGVHNFRDYGGYAGAGGAQVKSGLLWRSAQHVEASDTDLEAIHGLGIATVIDLRGPSEYEANPCRRHSDFSAQVFATPRRLPDWRCIPRRPMAWLRLPRRVRP